MHLHFKPDCSLAAHYSFYLIINLNSCYIFNQFIDFIFYNLIFASLQSIFAFSIDHLKYFKYLSKFTSIFLHVFFEKFCKKEAY